MQKLNLSLIALRICVMGVEARSFAFAAERTGRPTSAVSAQLKKLESQIGSPLIKTAGRGLALTESGKGFCPMDGS